MDASDLVGGLASIGSMASFAPQAWRIIKTRNVKDLSPLMYTLSTSAFALWAVYGFLLGKWPIIVTNLVCLALAGFILLMRVLPGHQREAVADALDPDARPDARPG